MANDYIIERGPAPMGVERPETRGRKPAFPIQDMQIGDWFTCPRWIERKLWQSARYHKQKFGIQLQVMLDKDGANWIAVRIK